MVLDCLGGGALAIGVRSGLWAGLSQVGEPITNQDSTKSSSVFAAGG